MEMLHLALWFESYGFLAIIILFIILLGVIAFDCVKPNWSVIPYALIIGSMFVSAFMTGLINDFVNEKKAEVYQEVSKEYGLEFI